MSETHELTSDSKGGTFGDIDFQGGTAGNGVFLINGGTEARALGGSLLFSGGTAGNATLIANPGTNGGYGGQIQVRFFGRAWLK